jgi:hypothetical protein
MSKNTAKGNAETMKVWVASKGQWNIQNIKESKSYDNIKEKKK